MNVMKNEFTWPVLGWAVGFAAVATLIGPGPWKIQELFMETAPLCAFVAACVWCLSRAVINWRRYGFRVAIYGYWALALVAAVAGIFPALIFLSLLSPAFIVAYLTRCSVDALEGLGNNRPTVLLLKWATLMPAAYFLFDYLLNVGVGIGGGRNFGPGSMFGAQAPSRQGAAGCLNAYELGDALFWATALSTVAFGALFEVARRARPWALTHRLGLGGLFAVWSLGPLFVALAPSYLACIR